MPDISMVSGGIDIDVNHNVNDSLELHVRQITELFTTGDYASVTAEIDKSPLLAWYGFAPERLREILTAILESGRSSSPTTHGLHQFLLLGEDLPSGQRQASSFFDALPPSAISRFRPLQAFLLRIQGQAAEAMHILDETERQSDTTPLFFNPAGGWDLWLNVQAGITAMLAGDFRRALTYFAEAQFHPQDPSLAFLSRDAYVKAALIHASFGNDDEAQLNLAHSLETPRTISWAERLIDANAAMTHALLEDDHDNAIRLLVDIPLQAVGEMWPFYVIAVHKVFTRAGRLRELKQRIAVLEKIPFPRTKGIAFTGSVLPQIRALMNIRANDLSSAQWFIDSADSSHVLTRLLSSHLELRKNRHQRAIDAVWPLREQTEGFRDLELSRYLILATANLRLGRKDLATDYLRTAVDNITDLKCADFTDFPEELRQFGANTVAAWPDECGRMSAGNEAIGATDGHTLTDRERQILQMLADGSSRAEMATKLFISVNTLKTHLSAIYRKLDVTNREAALAKAEYAGWV